MAKDTERKEMTLHYQGGPRVVIEVLKRRKPFLVVVSGR